MDKARTNCKPDGAVGAAFDNQGVKTGQKHGGCQAAPGEALTQMTGQRRPEYRRHLGCGREIGRKGSAGKNDGLFGSQWFPVQVALFRQQLTSQAGSAHIGRQVGSVLDFKGETGEIDVQYASNTLSQC